jgi:hypothetical protein
VTKFGVVKYFRIGYEMLGNYEIKKNDNLGKAMKVTKGYRTRVPK